MPKINLLPIHWFGDKTAYMESPLRVVTVGLNPSDREFRPNDHTPVSTGFRFPDYDGSAESHVRAMNAYFVRNPYNAWFKSSFGAVLSSFDASFYPGAINTAIHTDICSPWATIPTWSKLDEETRNRLEAEGHLKWTALMEELQPDIILFSSSPGHEQKLDFPSTESHWREVDVKAARPLLIRRFEIGNKACTVFFQVQGRKPFLQTAKIEKLGFKRHAV